MPQYYVHALNATQKAVEFQQPPSNPLPVIIPASQLRLTLLLKQGVNRRVQSEAEAEISLNLQHFDVEH